jgi:hypothetical protein
MSANALKRLIVFSLFVLTCGAVASACLSLSAY